MSLKDQMLYNIYCCVPRFNGMCPFSVWPELLRKIHFLVLLRSIPCHIPPHRLSNCMDDLYTGQFYRKWMVLAIRAFTLQCER